MRNRLTPLYPAAVFAAMMLTSCSEAPPLPAPTEAVKEPVKAAEPSPAKQAYWKMYKPAFQWSKDVQLLSMANKAIPEMKGGSGKEAVWEAVFVSASKREARKAVYSEVDHGTEIHKGVEILPTMTWSGPTREYAPFQNSEFGVDSDAAYHTAAAKASSWIKAHPNESVNLLLAKAAAYSTPVWVVKWGDSKSGYVAVVNATTGDLISPK